MDGNTTDAPAPRSRRGFAAMDPEKQREIARKGGRASGGRPENLRGVDRRAAGKKGGQAVVDKYGPQHMAEIGRKGGRSSGGFGRMEAARPADTPHEKARPGFAEAPYAQRHVDEATRGIKAEGAHAESSEEPQGTSA